MAKMFAAFFNATRCKSVGSFLPKDACVNLVDLVKSFQTSIYLQTLALIQLRTSLVNFAKISQQLE